MRRLQAWFYWLIRPIFVTDIDPNEDFSCGLCGNPVLRRVLFCSSRCCNEFHANHVPDECL